jgi:hypothetical protein
VRRVWVQAAVAVSAIARVPQAHNVAGMPCKTSSFYAQGVKVRSGESHFFTDGAWRRVVLTTPAEGEVHVRSLPEGASISLLDGLVLQVWQERLFGKKGRRVDYAEEARHFTSQLHRRLYLNRLLQTSTDPALLRLAVEQDWDMQVGPGARYLKRNAAAVQRLYDELVGSSDQMPERMRISLLQGLTDEDVLFAGTLRLGSIHAALPRLSAIASEDTVVRAINQALAELDPQIVSRSCRDLPVPMIAAALKMMLQRLDEAEDADKQNHRKLITQFLICSGDAYVVNSPPSVAAAAIALMDQGVQFPYSVMTSRGALQERLEQRDNQPIGVWKRVGAQTPNGESRVMKRRGRIACVLELPRDAAELVELLDDEDIAVQRAALERLDDPERWRKALDAGEWQGYFAERAPLELLTALIDESSEDDLQPTLIRIARERGRGGVAPASAVTCSAQGLHTATHSSDPDEIAAVLRAAVEVRESKGNPLWSVSVRIIQAVVARSQDPEQLQWLSENLSDTGRGEYFTPRIEARLRELELSELVWQATLRGETHLARGAITQMEASDLLWEMNCNETLSRYAGERLVALLKTA